MQTIELSNTSFKTLCTRDVSAIVLCEAVVKNGDMWMVRRAKYVIGLHMYVTPVETPVKYPCKRCNAEI